MAKHSTKASKAARSTGAAKSSTKARRTARTAAARKAVAAKTTRTKAKLAATSKSKAKTKTKTTAKDKRKGSKAKRATTTKTATANKKAPAARAQAARKRTRSEPRTVGSLTVYDDDRPLPKTKLTRKDLEEFRQLLLAKRLELIGDVGNLTGEALGRNRTEAAGDLSSMPIHMADIGSDNWEQEFTLGLIDNERKLLREIDHALGRIKSRTYGVCLATHKPISKARLRAKPWAKYCIEYARLREVGRVP